jgi:hypothetical protein
MVAENGITKNANEYFLGQEIRRETPRLLVRSGVLKGLPQMRWGIRGWTN